LKALTHGHSILTTFLADHEFLAVFYLFTAYNLSQPQFT